ncbi:MAG: hypothetical protein ABIC40_01755 [bacterium]
MRNYPFIISIIIFSLIFSGCLKKEKPSQAAPKPEKKVEYQLVADKISGQPYVYADASMPYSISATGDTGITFQWSCVPPDVGIFSPSDGTDVSFTAGNVKEPMDVKLTVEIAADHSGKITESHDLKIYPALAGWVKKWGKTRVSSIAPIVRDSAGNIFAAGSFTRTADFDPGPGVDEYKAYGETDGYVTKLDPNGKYQWTRTFGGNNPDSVRAVAVDSSGNSYAVGGFKGTAAFNIDDEKTKAVSNGERDSFIVKSGPNGEFKWLKTWGAERSLCEAISVAMDASGNVVVCGSFNGTIDFNPGDGIARASSIGRADIYVSKFSPSGNLIANRVWGGKDPATDMCFPNDIAVDGSNAVYVVGRFRGGFDFSGSGNIESFFGEKKSGGDDDAFVCKLSSTLTPQWSQIIGGPAYDTANGVSVGSGGVLVTGGFEGIIDLNPGSGKNIIESAPAGDAFLIKFSTSGRYVWAKTWVAAQGLSVAADPSGNIIVTGSAVRSGGFGPGPGSNMPPPPQNGPNAGTGGNGPPPSSTGGMGMGTGGSGNRPLGPPSGNSAPSRGNSAPSFGNSDFGPVGAGNPQPPPQLGGSGVMPPPGAPPSGGGPGMGGVGGPGNRPPGPPPARDDLSKPENNLDGSVFVMKFSSSGSFLWAKAWGRTEYDMGTGVITDKNGNIFVGGMFRGDVTWVPNGGFTYLSSVSDPNAFIMKFLPDGSW